MTQYPAGIVMGGSEGCVHLRIWDERYIIQSEDLGVLVFLGELVPLIRDSPQPNESSVTRGVAHLNRSGRAVLLEIGNQCYLIPRDRFVMVALGDEVSTPIAEIAIDGGDSAINLLWRGGVLS